MSQERILKLGRMKNQRNKSEGENGLSHDQILKLISSVNRRLSPRPRNPLLIRNFSWIVRRRRRLLKRMLIWRNPLNESSSSQVEILVDLLENIRRELLYWLIENRTNLDFDLDYDIYLKSEFDSITDVGEFGPIRIKLRIIALF